MLLSQLSTAVLSAQDTGSYLAITLGSALVQTKRNFDRYTIFCNICLFLQCKQLSVIASWQSYIYYC